MSINGLQQQYFANSLDGLTYLDVNGISINGDNIDLPALVPYSNADKPVDVGVQPIRTSYIPTLNNDVVNLLALNQTTTGTVGYVDQYYVPYTGSISNTNLGNKNFTVGLGGDTSLSNLVRTELNNVLGAYTPASIVVGNNFGTISNAGGVYESTSTATFASLFLGTITPGEKYSVSISAKCIDVNYTTQIYIYEASAPNYLSGGIQLLSLAIPPNTTGFNVLTGTINPTLTNLLLVFSTQIISGINTLYWNAFSLTGMGSVIKNLISPTTSLDGANKGYVDTQDALRVPYVGSTANLNLGSNSLISTTAQFTAITSATPSLALGVDGSGNLRSFAVNPNLIPLNNTWTGTNSYSNTVSLTSVATATATFTLGLNGSNQIVKYTPSSGIGGSVSAGYVPYASSANTLANSVLFQSGTSVGIGTVSPSALLHIYGSATVGDRNSSLIVSTQRAGLYLASLGAGGTDWNIWSTLTGEGAGAGALAFYNQTNNAYGMVINSAGKIGMGTITPADKLTVQTATENYGVIHTDGTVSVGTYASSTNGGYVGTKSNHKLNFMTNNGVARLTIDTAGNVGIGTQNPAYKLDVQGAMRVRDGDNSRCVYGPNTTWGANLIVGSGPEVSGPATAGVISTNGNLHLDGGNSNAIYYGYYANSHGTPNQHLFYGGDYQYNGMPQNSSAYSHVCVLNGDRMFRSQAVAHQVVVYASNSWGPGTNLTYAFYRYNGWTSQMIIGRLSYYVTGNTMAYPTIRIYSQSTGQYWFFQTNNYTNNGYNHITVPIYAIFNEGYTTATGWFDIYVYNNGGANTDTNDILDIHVITLPVSSY